MIQEMTANYLLDFLVNYAKAGLIGWAVWFVSAFVYVICSFKLDLSLYNDEDSKERKWTFSGVLRTILWPWGMLHSTGQIVKYVTVRLSGKEQKR